MYLCIGFNGGVLAVDQLFMLMLCWCFVNCCLCCSLIPFSFFGR